VNETTANIHPGALVPASVSIGHHVVNEENVTRGEHTEILHNTVMGKPGKKMNK
jgi:serine acetyltransferase